LARAAGETVEEVKRRETARPGAGLARTMKTDRPPQF